MSGDARDHDAVLAPWRERWSLRSDGDAFATPSSVLQPVRRGEQRLFLKRAVSHEERVGGDVLAWWHGEGAVRVLVAEEDVQLLERADGPRDLAALARSGLDGDDEATRILCRAGQRLHAAGTPPRPAGLFPLRRWFRDLIDREHDDDLLAEARATALDLLAHPAGDVVLHGDLHHGNVLDGGERGWLAIDPKPLHGDPGFDVANVLCNPDAGVALAPGRLERAVGVIASETGMGERRILCWALAWGALSAVWSEADGGDPTAARGVARRARALLGPGAGGR
ncbi:MAG: aminoglycoside phosphotransferase family protein [Leifsonia sp.]